jgi:hypothetical protein
MIFDTPEKIQGFRMLTLSSALKLEMKGMRVYRGKTAYSRIKEEFNLKGSREKVYEQFEEILIEMGIKERK